MSTILLTWCSTLGIRVRNRYTQRERLDDQEDLSTMRDSADRRFDGVGVEGDDIRHLFSYNLQRLAGLSSRIASLKIREGYDLSTIEWRALAVLDFLEAAPLHLL